MAEKKHVTAAQVIDIYSKLLEAANAQIAEATGSCSYPVGIGGVYCQNNLTKAQCDEFVDSTWTENAKCPTSGSFTQGVAAGTAWIDQFQTYIDPGQSFEKIDGWPNPAKVEFSADSPAAFTLHIEDNNRDTVYHSTATISGSPVCWIVGWPSSGLRKVHVANPNAKIRLTVYARG